MVLEGETFVDAGEAAAWCEEKVREVLDDSEIVDEIFRYFGAVQTRHGLRSFLNYGVRRNRRIPWAALIVQRGRLWEAGGL